LTHGNKIWVSLLGLWRSAASRRVQRSSATDLHLWHRVQQAPQYPWSHEEAEI